MLYPARCKRITVDQSKVLKKWLFRFFGATRYSPSEKTLDKSNLQAASFSNSLIESASNSAVFCYNKLLGTEENTSSILS